MGFFDNLFGSKSSSTNSIPKYLENSSKQVIGKAKDLVAKKKYTPYKGDLVADKNKYYTSAAATLNHQRDLAGENFAQADRILDGTKAGTKDYYNSVQSAVNRLNPLSKDYFANTARNLGGMDRGGEIYDEADTLLDRGSRRFNASMDRSKDQIGQAASHGDITEGAIGQYGSLPGLVRNAQGRAEALQLGGNAGLRSTLGREMGESGTGYDEASALTRKASRLDSTNGRAIDARMNPYTDAVTDMALRDFNKQRGIGATKVNDAARAAGAFGGSRHGIAQGMYDEETSKGLSDIITSQREKGYDAATRRLDADRANLLSSAGQLAGTQGARDSGTLAFTGQIGDLTARDAALLRQGGLDAAGATKDAAAGAMSGERALYDMDADTAKLYADLAKSYSDESKGMAGAKLSAQGQRFGQDMDYNSRMESIAKDRLAQQGQQFNQDMDLVSARDNVAKGRLGQEQQRFGQNLSLADAQSQLGQEDQRSRQAMAADLLGYGKEERAIRQAELDSRKSQFDERQQYPFEQLNWLASIIGGQPYSRASTSNSSQGMGNSILGALSTGIGAFLSDENEKENREDADLEDILASFKRMPIDEYDYKDRAVASGAAPDGRRTGPMAQDWQKEFGGDGRTIDMAEMLGKMAGAIKGLEERTAEPKQEEPKRGLPRRKVA